MAITIHPNGLVTGGKIRSSGSVIQVVSQAFDPYGDTGLRADSGTYSDSGMTISITPTLSTSKILAISTGTSFGYKTSSDNVNYLMRLIATHASISTLQLREIEVRKSGEGSSTSRLFDSWTMVSNHDHNTTQTITYKVQHKTATTTYAWARYKGGDMHLLEIAQ